jgi:DNA-binding MarR family transcriptional regulator
MHASGWYSESKSGDAFGGECCAMSRDHTLEPTVQRAMRAFLAVISLTEPYSMDFWRAHELTLMQVRCLRRLRGGPLTAGDLARRLGLSAASMTRLLERLESRGLVQRTMDIEDRRRVLVELTEAGRETTGTLGFWLDSPALKALEALEPQDCARVADALELLAERLGHEIATSPR